MLTGRLAKLLLYALPAAAVAVVAFATLVVGAPRPFAAARLQGGPTEGAPVLAWRLEAFERLGDQEFPLVGKLVTVTVQYGGRRETWRGTLDEEGAASPSIDVNEPVSGRVHVAVTSPGRTYPLVQGEFSLSVEAWRKNAGRRGGWLTGPRAGTLEVFVAPERGVFAVPFPGHLWVEVRRKGRPQAGVGVTVTADGATVSLAERTDDRGRARFAITPKEHSVSFTVHAKAEGEEGRFDGSLPVVPGALWAALDGDSLRVASAIPREMAYATLVTDAARLAGAAVPLLADANGGAVGRWKLPAPLREERPLWAVVSSESDQRSMALVGWPITASMDEPASTFDVRDNLLLDGSRVAFDLDVQRRRRARLFAVLFAVSAMALAVILLALRVRQSRRALEAHLSEASEGTVSPEQVSASVGLGGVLAVLVALLCVALGFAAVSLISLLGR